MTKIQNPIFNNKSQNGGVHQLNDPFLTCFSPVSHLLDFDENLQSTKEPWAGHEKGMQGRETTMSQSVKRSLKQMAPYFVSWVKSYAKSARRVLRSRRSAVILALGTLD